MLNTCGRKDTKVVFLFPSYDSKLILGECTFIMQQLPCRFCIYVSSLIIISILSACSITISPGFGKPSMHTSTAPMLRKVLPAVVNVFSEGRNVNCTAVLPNNPILRKQLGLDKNPYEKCLEQSQGSGVIIDAKKGYIVTNYHNIENAERTIVTLKDRRQILATIVGVDPETDLALLKIEADHLSELPLTNADKKLETGDFLVAIGSPFGLDHSVSFGIVSALGRSGLGLEGYEDFIQTDASINIGNSGGAIVAMNGKLVGISSAIVGANNSNTGIGFAISGSMAKAVVEQLVKYGEVKRGQIGIMIDDVMLNNKLRAIISLVLPNSPAEKAGLKTGDIVLSYNGEAIYGSNKLHNALGLARVGDTVRLKVLRNNKQLIIHVTLGIRA